MNNSKVIYKSFYGDLCETHSDEYQCKFFDFIHDLGFYYVDGPLPLGITKAFAEALASASGLQVVLKAEEVQTDATDSKFMHKTGTREVAAFEPKFFLLQTPDQKDGTDDEESRASGKVEAVN